jgi:hypothetical protein
MIEITVKTWMAASLMASFVAVFAKTGCPTYIEKHRKQQQSTSSSFPKSKKRS